MKGSVQIDIVWGNIARGPRWSGAPRVCTGLEGGEG